MEGNDNLWLINMIVCIAIAFGSFIYSIKLAMDADQKKTNK